MKHRYENNLVKGRVNKSEVKVGSQQKNGAGVKMPL